MSAKKHRRKTEICPNCQTILSPEANFCLKCGQENHDLKVPIGHLAYEVVESITHFDTKLWNTLTAIFTKPGKITRDFLEGKRASHVHPVRLYVFVSFVFFLLLTKLVDNAVATNNEKVSKIFFDNNTRWVSLDLFLKDSFMNKPEFKNLKEIDIEISTDSNYLLQSIQKLANYKNNQIDSLLAKAEIPVNNENNEKLRIVLDEIVKRKAKAIPDSLYHIGVYNMAFNTQSQLNKFKEDIQLMSKESLDSVLKVNGHDTGWGNRLMLKRFSKFDWQNKAERNQIIHAIIKSASLTMFLLMPFVALLLLWLFYRKKYYYEHLIFSIHIHSIYLIIFSFLLILHLYISEMAVWAILSYVFIAIIIYLLMSLKYVYGKSWLSTIFRFLAMTIPYFIISFLFFTLAMVFGFLNS